MGGSDYLGSECRRVLQVLPGTAGPSAMVPEKSLGQTLLRYHRGLVLLCEAGQGVFVRLLFQVLNIDPERHSETPLYKHLVCVCVCVCVSRTFARIHFSQLVVLRRYISGYAVPKVQGLIFHFEEEPRTEMKLGL